MEREPEPKGLTPHHCQHDKYQSNKRQKLIDAGQSNMYPSGNLGGLASGRQMLRERDGPRREGEEPKPMMHGHEKSDPAIVAMKPANKAKEA
jgi:hypothetical protein